MVDKQMLNSTIATDVTHEDIIAGYKVITWSIIEHLYTFYDKTLLLV